MLRIDIAEDERVMLYDVYGYQPPEGGPAGDTAFALRMRVERG